MKSVKAIEKELQDIERAASRARKGEKGEKASPKLPPLPPIVPSSPALGPRKVYNPEIQRLMDAGYVVRGDLDGTETLFCRVGKTEQFRRIGEYPSKSKAWEAAERDLKKQTPTEGAKRAAKTAVKKTGSSAKRSR